ncbi:MAG: UDP-N-acetylmuramoyl-tripeptide--D-alanyl-D-alanine ligase [Deferribacteres bacterium]|nr:UDP-N-acetylmuramoyl-tripeptide--D-alanyl-D-alanine ligase [candidate division KSB1 bacterium]MCB9501782.1 UDP-N-acetylmuramoyl-tripeptide--D-alanyl-D-alanine ligase [Deferribacteres bacterium]
MQNMKWTLREVVTAWDYSYSLQNADNVLDQTIVAVSIDSRKMQPGDLFVAISGDVFDGHNFVKQALEKGALAAVVSKQWLQKNPGFAGRTLIVEDTLVALQKIAAAYRKKLNPFVFALTGTNGKTTTKEMIANVVSAEKTTHKTTGNLNNHIGVPLTLLAMREPVEVAVVEMGMNHAREILTLCEIAQPNAVLITNIGRGHTEFFGGLEGVKKAKQEIFDYIAPRGTACVNIDDTNVVRAAHDAGVALMCKYGFSPEAEIRGENLSLGEDGCARFSWNGAMIRVAIPGLHNGHNALAAIAAGSVTGISPAKIIDAVQKEIAVSGRMNKLEVGHRTVLDDSYNANPESMLAALGTLVSLPGKGKRYAALGDMLELGVLAEESHKSVLQAAIDKNLDFVFTYGPEMEKATKKLQNSRIRHFKSKDEIISEIQKMSEPGDVLLIKGSRGMRMEDILTALQNKLPV